MCAGCWSLAIPEAQTELCSLLDLTTITLQKHFFYYKILLIADLQNIEDSMRPVSRTEALHTGLVMRNSLWPHGNPLVNVVIHTQGTDKPI